MDEREMPSFLDAAKKLVGVVEEHGCGFDSQEDFWDAMNQLKVVIKHTESRAKTLVEALELVGDPYQAFEIAYISMNGFHTRKEVATAWESGRLASEMFRAGLMVGINAKDSI